MAIGKETFSRAARAALLWGIESANNDWQDVSDTEDSVELAETYDSFSPPSSVQEDTGAGFDPVTGVRFSFIITNKTWTVSLHVQKDSLNDDQLGAFRNRIRLIGTRMSNHLRKRCYDQLFAGESNLSYDGSNFFANTHNDWTGDNLATSQAAAGDSVPTLAELETEYNVVIATILEFTDRFSEPIWQDDSELVMIVGPQMRTVARQLLLNDLTTNGQTNINKGTAKLVITPHNEDTGTVKSFIIAKMTPMMRPMIYQRREGISTVTDENIEKRTMFFGAEARYEFGFGHPYAAIKHQFTT